MSHSVSHWVGVSHYRLYTNISPSVSHWVGVSRYTRYIQIFHLQWGTGWGFHAIYTDISPSVSIWVGVSRYIHWHFTFSEHLGGGFSLYTLTFHLQWASGWGFLAIYTDISPSVTHWVGVSRYIHWHFTFSENLGGGFSLYTDISTSVSHWVMVSRYIYWHFTFSESLGRGFSLYTQIFHLQWASGWGFLAIYTDISPSVSHWVGVSRYIYRYFTFCQPLGGGFLLYIQIFHILSATGWGFLAIHSDISPSVSHWVVVSRHIYCYFIFSESLGGSFSLYIHWHFTFSEHLGGGFSPYILLFHLQWVTGWGFLAIYTAISSSVSHWVGVSRHIYCYFIYSESLGGCFSLYIHWHFTSVSIWVGVSRYIHWYFTFSEHLGGGFSLYTMIFHLQWASGWGFSLYTLTFHLQWASGWGFLAIYTDISPSVSIWVGVSRYIHWYFTFSEHLGGGFSLYILIFHLQWASGWGFLAIYTDISPSVSIWVGVSRYIHWHFTFSEHLGGGFSLYTLTFHLQWASGWGFLAIYTDISPSVSHWVVVSRYIYWHFTFSESLGGGFSLYSLIFHLQWASGWGFLAIYTDISPSVSIWVGVSCYIYRYFTFCQPLGGGFSLYILTFHLQWVTGWGFLAIYTAISSSVSHWVGVSRYIYTDISPQWASGWGFLAIYTLTFHLQWVTGWGFLAIYTSISSSVSHWVGVSRYIYTDISPQWASGWGFLAI